MKRSVIIILTACLAMTTLASCKEETSTPIDTYQENIEEAEKIKDTLEERVEDLN